MLHKNKGNMIVKTNFGEDKLKFTVTYLDGKKLPKDLAGRVRHSVENINEVDGLLDRFDSAIVETIELKKEIEDLKKELEQVQLDSDNNEELLHEQMISLKHEKSYIETKYRDVLELSNRQIWAMVALAAVSLISLSLYFSSL